MKEYENESVFEVPGRPDTVLDVLVPTVSSGRGVPLAGGGGLRVTGNPRRFGSAGGRSGGAAAQGRGHFLLLGALLRLAAVVARHGDGVTPAGPLHMKPMPLSWENTIL
jgi:hypothetical protein